MFSLHVSFPLSLLGKKKKESFSTECQASHKSVPTVGKSQPSKQMREDQNSFIRSKIDSILENLSRHTQWFNETNTS